MVLIFEQELQPLDGQEATGQPVLTVQNLSGAQGQDEGELWNADSRGKGMSLYRYFSKCRPKRNSFFLFL